MESLIVLIPLSVIIVAVAIGAFLWAVNNGQYDEPERDARRALADGDHPDLEED
jgi:cbb3-type cytochrome oxidase maturation protein